MKVTGLVLTLACLSSTAFANENGTIKIHDAQRVPQIISMILPGKLIMEDGQDKVKSKKISKAARILNSNLEKTRDYYATEFGRKSWDNKGSPIIASLNVNRFTLYDFLGSKQNAAWAGTRFIFGAGSWLGLDQFEEALDVVAHEYTHAVIQTTSNLQYNGQSGALNEHFADVFGSIVNQVNNPNLSNPYLIGSSVLGIYKDRAVALRDMMNPKRGLSAQPGHMSDLTKEAFKEFDDTCKEPNKKNDRCGVHVLSGIPNKMSALVMSKIGPQESAKLFFNVMTKRLKPNSLFAHYRVALLEECKSLATDTCSIVEDALNQVGIVHQDHVAPEVEFKDEEKDKAKKPGEEKAPQ